MALAQDHLDAYAVCYTKAVDRLNRVRAVVIVSYIVDQFYSSLSSNTNTQLHMHTTRYHLLGFK